MRFRVADFDAWRKGYERAIASPLGADLRSHRVWRGQDDPNLVLIEETYASRELAQAAIDDPATREAMEADGIDLSSLQLDYLDEVSS
jgi:hypothetical protein